MPSRAFRAGERASGSKEGAAGRASTAASRRPPYGRSQGGERPAGGGGRPCNGRRSGGSGRPMRGQSLKRPRGRFRVRKWEKERADTGGYKRFIQGRGGFFFDHGFGIERGGGRDHRRRGKSPELPEEGELMLEVPTPPPKKETRPSKTQEERIARVIENAEMRHAWFV
ncbi:hypothetical protein R1flu_027054 [Riccia fluitans]|uniref:Uncharacterized protein n=1 Tax=Riccia fluitans TaxID=41844 RepID=A0ABD1XHR3_9MARC